MIPQWRAMVMLGRFLTVESILSQGRETGKSLGHRRRERDPGMLPEVRRKCSAAACWVPSLVQ